MGKIQNIYNIKAKPKKVFKYVENIWNIKYHLNLIGVKLKLEILSENIIGVGAAYHWYGDMLDKKINSIMFVVKRVNNKEIIYQSHSGLQFNIILHLTPLNNSTKIDFTLNYLKPSSWSYDSSPKSLFNQSFLKKIIDMMFETIKGSLELQNKIII